MVFKFKCIFVLVFLYVVCVRLVLIYGLCIVMLCWWVLVISDCGE